MIFARELSIGSRPDNAARTLSIDRKTLPDSRFCTVLMFAAIRRMNSGSMPPEMLMRQAYSRCLDLTLERERRARERLQRLGADLDEVHGLLSDGRDTCLDEGDLVVDEAVAVVDEAIDERVDRVELAMKLRGLLAGTYGS